MSRRFGPRSNGSRTGAWSASHLSRPVRTLHRQEVPNHCLAPTRWLSHGRATTSRRSSSTRPQAQALAVRFSYVFAMARRCPRGGLSDLTVSPPRIRLRRLRVRNFLSVGFKGSNIAMMVELLAGPLLGDALSFEAGERDKANTGAPCGGELIIAIDPIRCMENGDRIAQLDHGEMLFKKMLEQDGARLPSDRRYEARKRTAIEGVKVPRSLYESIQSYITGTRIKERNAYEGDHLTHQKETGLNAVGV